MGGWKIKMCEALACEKILIGEFIMTKSTPYEGNENTTGSYASVNGFKMYYELHVTGRPLIPLPCGVPGDLTFFHVASPRCFPEPRTLSWWNAPIGCFR